MWILLIISLFLLSVFVTIKIKYKNYSIKYLLKSLNKDKTSLFLSLGTKIGVGSIVGVVSSIMLGGVSSVLWMFIFSFISSSLIYYESFLGFKYRKKINSNYVGGPYYIIKYGNKKPILASISLILLIITYSFLFQMIQTNTISSIININMSIKPSVVFIMFMIILLLTISFSIKEVLSVMNKIVPIMCLLFIILCLFIISDNISHIDNALIYAFKSFNIKSFLVGSVIGIKRSIFMNEVLIGTTSLCSSSDNNDIDTSISIQVLCSYFISFINGSLLSLIVLIYNFNEGAITNNYNLLISNIFYKYSGSIGVYLLIIIFIMFGITTILSGYYIGKSNIEYLTSNKKVIKVFKILFLTFSLTGIMLENFIIWQIIDIFMFIMIIINIYSIIHIMRNKYDR